MLLTPFFTEAAHIAGYGEASHALVGSDADPHVLSPHGCVELLSGARTGSVVNVLKDLRKRGVTFDRLPAAIGQIAHLAHIFRDHSLGISLATLVAPQSGGSRYDHVYSAVPKGFIDNTNPDPFVQHLVDGGYVHGGETVFDDGAGNGRNSHALARAGARKCFAVDSSPSAIRQAQLLVERNQETGETVSIVSDNTRRALGRCVKSGNKIDLYLATSRFHLDPRRFGNGRLPSFEDRLAFVRNALSEAGLLAFTLKTPNSPTIKRAKKLHEWDGGVSVWSGHERVGRWAETMDNLVRAVEEARFDILCATTGSYPYDLPSEDEIFHWIIARKKS